MPEASRLVLRTADRRLRRLRSGDRSEIYRICRIALSALAPVDSFYIGLIRDESTMVFPYTYDRGEFLSPDIIPYRPGGLTHWIKASRQTYRWSDDNGMLLNRGVPFGVEEDVSSDALVAPMIGTGSGDVVGLISIQTYRPQSYTEDHVEALEWLANAVVLTISRDEEDRARNAALYPELDTRVITDLEDLADHLWVRLEQIQTAIAALAAEPEIRTSAGLTSDLVHLARLCEDLQIETADASSMVARAAEAKTSTGAVDDARPILTPRERDIVLLIVDGLSNHEIADRLEMAEKTVKTHVTRILRKFNVTQRSGVAWQIRSWNMDV
jgi:DNA-binding CsgD family transcriptional regulator